MIRRPANASGWVRLPICWTAEQTFAWFDKKFRLNLDLEKTTLSSEMFVRVAMIHRMLNCLKPKGEDVPYCYRKNTYVLLMGRTLRS